MNIHYYIQVDNLTPGQINNKRALRMQRKVYRTAAAIGSASSDELSDGEITNRGLIL